jgi:hypothetical protein
MSSLWGLVLVAGFSAYVRARVRHLAALGSRVGLEQLDQELNWLTAEGNYLRRTLWRYFDPFLRPPK